MTPLGRVTMLTAGPGCRFTQKEEIQTWRANVDSRGDGVQMNWEAGTDIRRVLTLCMKQTVSKNLAHSTASLT